MSDFWDQGRLSIARNSGLRPERDPGPDKLSDAWAIVTVGALDLPYDNSEPEERVWISVIVQALNDATYVDPRPDDPVTRHPNDNKRREMRTEQMRARAWLRGNTRDFHEVCAMAGVSTKLVKRIFGQLTNGQTP